MLPINANKVRSPLLGDLVASRKRALSCVNHLTFYQLSDYKKQMYTIVEKAGAKINLHLNVLNKREDGYHNLFSLMAGLELHDIVILEYYDLVKDGSPPEIRIENGGGTFSHILDSIDVNDNLITCAVKNYLKRAGLSGELHFVVEKNIPHGAGLAGGSSDAAAALRAIHSVVKPEIDGILSHSAIETGSDVPFCLNGGLAFVEMKGETIIPVNQGLKGFVLLINNGIQINTGHAYGLLNREFPNERSNYGKANKKEIISALEKGITSWDKTFMNDFEVPVFNEYPQLRLLKSRLYDAGAEFASMTGSGSTVFGVFSDEKACMEAFHHFEIENNRCFFSKFLIPAVL